MGSSCPTTHKAVVRVATIIIYSLNDILGSWQISNAFSLKLKLYRFNSCTPLGSASSVDADEEEDSNYVNEVSVSYRALEANVVLFGKVSPC